MMLVKILLIPIVAIGILVLIPFFLLGFMYGTFKIGIRVAQEGWLNVYEKSNVS